MKVHLSSVLLLLAALAAPAAPAAAQEPFAVQGQVRDELTQQPLPNVSVLLRGTSLGTLTDQNGNYRLVARVAPGDYVLQYRLIGRREATREVTLGPSPTVQVEPVLLQTSAVQLEEIVVTGTGAPTERRAIGNNVESIAGAEVADAPAAATIDQALQARVTGAVISENSGQPGGGVSIRLRGTSTILGGAEPLIVVDGVIVDNTSEALVGLGANANRGAAALSNRLGDLSPQDIERIEVIKGAAAAALYGSRANNGVIQIFTRRGSQGEPRISASTTLEVNQTPGTYDLVQLPFAGRADVVFGPANAIGDPVERFDFQDEIFRTGVGTDNQVSIAGGSEGTAYYLSGGFRRDEGILEGSDNTRINVLGKLTQQLASWLEVTGSATFVDSESHFVPEGEQTYGALTGVIFTPTSFDFGFDPELGRFPITPVLAFNPLDVIANWEAPEDVTRFLGSFESTLRPRDDLTIRYLFGVDDYRLESKFYRPPFSESAVDPGLIQNPIRTSRQFNHDVTANHELAISPSLTLSSTPGVRYSQSRAVITRAGASDLLPGVTLIEGATQFASQSQEEVRIFGGWLQERLAINDRLFLTGGVNFEAASAFGDDQRWQAYPRLGASWVLDEEPFWTGNAITDLFTTLRLRAAYGETGGQPPGNFLAGTFFPGVAFSSRPGVVQSTTLGNPDLEPERQNEWEIGFEAGMFDDRVLVEFTYYDQETENLILPVPLPPSSGANQQYQNIGAIENQGIEVALNTLNVNRPGVEWSSRLQVASNQNEVTRLASAADTLFIPGGGYPNVVMVGQPVGVFYGRGCLRQAGEIVIDPATGLCARDPNFRILGDPNPDFTAALSNTVRLGDAVQLDVLLDGRFGNDVVNFTRRITEYFGTDAVVEEEIRRAMEGGPPLQYALNAQRISNYEVYTEDGSFVKLREVSLSYRFPDALARGLGAETGRIRLAGRNLYTWTDYSGLDPEVNLFSANTVARGVDFATTPVPRSYVVGLEFSF